LYIRSLCKSSILKAQRILNNSTNIGNCAELGKKRKRVKVSREATVDVPILE
jgi:hypothetical protein